MPEAPEPYRLDHGIEPGFWLELDSPERFCELASAAADSQPADAYVTVTDLNREPVRCLKRLRVGPAIRMLDHRLAAHALAAAALRRRRPSARVGMTTCPVSFYEVGELLDDLLAAPARGIDRSTLHDWLVDRRREHNRRRPAGSAAARLVRRLVSDAIPLEQAFPRAQAAIFGSGE